MTTKIIEQYINHNGSWVPYEPMVNQNGIFNPPENLWVKHNGEYINNTWSLDLNVKGKRRVTPKFRPRVGDFVYSDKTWSTLLDESKTCVGVITDVKSKDFDFIALNDTDIGAWSTSNTIISDIFTTTDSKISIIDFSGKGNTEKIIFQLGEDAAPAADHCNNYSTAGFGAGSWYLPSAGQWQVSWLNKSKIDASIEAVGGTLPKSSSGYWVSTQYSNSDAWYVGWSSSWAIYNTSKGSVQNVRPFCTYEYNPVPNGVYIYDKDNNYYTKEEWLSLGKEVEEVLGIGISTDTNSFMVDTSISTARYAFGGQGTLIENVPFTNTLNPSIHGKPSHGVVYTDIIISSLGTGGAPAAEYAKSFQFKNAQKGYLPSYDEVFTLYNYKTQVEDVLNTLGISLWGDVSLQTCTQVGSVNNAALYWPSAGYSGPGKGDSQFVLVFTYLPFKGGIVEGAYILGSDGNLYIKDDWDNHSSEVEAEGVAVVTPESQFVIATEEEKTEFCTKLEVTDNIVTTSVISEAILDYKGKYNTKQYIAQYGLDNCPATEICRNYIANRNVGYIPSLGQLYLAWTMKSEISSLMSLIGGQAIGSTLLSSGSSYYSLWSSTQHSNVASWALYWDSDNLNYSSYIQKNLDSAVVRPVADLILYSEAEELENALVTPNYEVSKSKLTDSSGNASLLLRAYKDSTYSVTHPDFTPFSEEIKELSSDLSREVILEPGYTVNITIKENTDEGTTIGGADIKIESSDGTFRFMQKSTEGGLLTLDLLPENYTVEVSKGGYKSTISDLTVEDSEVAVTIALPKIYDLNVTVTRAEQPVSEANVSIYDNQEGVISAILSQMGRVLFKRTGDKAGTFIRLGENNTGEYFDGSTALLDGSEGDVMVYLPRLFYHYESLGGTKFAYKYSLVKEADDWIEIPASLIGAYKCYCENGKMYSRSGVNPTLSVSSTNLDNYAAARGTGYQTIDFLQHCQIAMLFYAKYKNRYSVSILGSGNASFNPITATGGTNNIGNNDTENTTSGWVSFSGIEGVCRGIYEYMSGISCPSSGTWIITEPNGETRTVSTGLGSSGWTKSMALENGPYFDMIPTEIGANSSSYYCDSANISSSGTNRIVCRSMVGPNVGIASIYIYYTNSATPSDMTSRLAFRGELTESKDVASYKSITAV